jgi:DNA-binding CsgD family transcriptional regulator
MITDSGGRFQDIDAFIQVVEAAKDKECIQKLIEIYINKLGFEYFGYLLLNPTVGSKNHIYITNKHKEWTLRWTIPIHGTLSTKALFSVSNNMSEDKFAALFMAERHALQIIATYAHENIMRLCKKYMKLPSVSLSPRESEVLIRSARGKTAWAISKILSLSEATVREYTAQACHKFCTGNKTHAVALAVMHALIIP